MTTRRGLNGKRSFYGYELVLDIHDADGSMFNRRSLRGYFDELCAEIQMKKEKVHFWDDVGVPPEEQQTLPHTRGTSAVCFILTSTIVVHTLELLGVVYVNIFSCKEFDPEAAERFTREWFKGRTAKSTWIERV